MPRGPCVGAHGASRSVGGWVRKGLTTPRGLPTVLEVPGVGGLRVRLLQSAMLAVLGEPLTDSFCVGKGTVTAVYNVCSSCGTTALIALVLGRLLMVANAGDYRAVLCRNGEAIDMSQDHRPNYPSERRRVEELGGFIDDGYLNGILSVTRA
ncbi:hypothetical protein KY290_001799 [Solanum tuberosum]|uniref:PPM-type phosphatase domain-containing protein n=1 Tax=Solanum tuberosum TaxID=4113 RepID=A0ABQ7WNC6_SOLTU|nr:hypothetical protein KY290_001799 [Solanum tuberosum]